MNKKGFTLVELLAVIVILAIISLIATPIILNIVEEARRDAAKDSAYGYVEAAKLNYVTTMNAASRNKSWSNTTNQLTVSGSTSNDYSLSVDETTSQVSGHVTVNGYKCVVTNGIISDTNDKTAGTGCFQP